MKKILMFALLAIMATGAQAGKKKTAAKCNKPVFTVVKQNKITSCLLYTSFQSFGGHASWLLPTW